MNVQDMLAAWDRGDPIVSVVMGGLGDSYEFALQRAAIEIARAWSNEKIENPESPTHEEKEHLMQIRDKALMDIDDDLGGLTGAMVGAAEMLAYQWCFHGGPEALIERWRHQGMEGSRQIWISTSGVVSGWSGPTPTAVKNDNKATA